MKKYLIASFAIAAVVVATIIVSNQASAQGTTAKTIITWQADTYTPDGFTGKVMPAADSRIIAGIDLIDAGKRVDLGPYQVYWYINDKFYQGGPGLARVSLTAPHMIGKNAIRVRAYITDYAGGVGKTITVPIAVPEAVIQSSAPNLAASAAPFNLRAYPYFFNVQNPAQLNYVWSINNVDVGNQNPFVATAEMAQNGPTRIEISINNPSRVIERITEDLTIFKK